MNGLEINRIFNKMIDNTRIVDVELRVVSLIIDKNIKKWHNTSIRDWW